MQILKKESPHLRNYLDILLKRKWTVLTSLVSLIVIVMFVSSRIEPVYQASCQLLIEKEKTDTVSFKEMIGIDTLDQDYYQTQYKILKSRSLAKEVIQKLGLEQVEEFSQARQGVYLMLRKAIFGENIPPQTLDMERIIDRFLNAIDVEPVTNTRLVKVKAKSHNPILAVHIANTLAQSYLSHNLEYRLFASRQVLEKLLSYGEKAGNHSQNTDLNELILSLPSVVNHPLIQELKQKYAELEVNYANLSQRYGPKHPKIVSVKSALEEMRRNMDLETERIVSAVKTELSGNLKSSNIKIIDLAEVPRKPITPNKKLNLILSLASGLILGCSLAFFFEYWDNTFKTEEDIERYLGLPFLGHIPTIRIRRAGKKVEKNIFLHTHPKSIAAEAFRNVRTGIHYVHSSGPVKTIMVTSAGPEEGKTLVAVNLAISMVQAGSRVLLVDTDMRRPAVHRILKLKNSFGISSYLQGESELGKIVQETFIENLGCVTCGPLPSNPSELLGSNRMEEFVEVVRERFDRVIFDTPPIISVADSLILGKLVDGAVQVVRFSKYPRDMVFRAKQRLQEMEIKIIGVVLNDIDIERSGRYYYPYYYRYYRKGYYQEEGKKNES
jgi:capsular exopolysaccharide synthesis family protein